MANGHESPGTIPVPQRRRRHAKEGGRLFVAPVLPAAWTGYTATLVLDGKKLSIRVDRADEGGWQATINGSVIKSSNEGYLL